MEQRCVIHNTFVIERSYPATPERVFAAFADPAKKRRWFAESDHHEVEEFEMDFRVGGLEHAKFRFKGGTPLAGAILTNDGSYQDIVPNCRIVFTYMMMLRENCISASLTTVELVPKKSGTGLILTHQGAFFEGSDGPQMREGGWRQLFDRLAGELES